MGIQDQSTWMATEFGLDTRTQGDGTGVQGRPKNLVGMGWDWMIPSYNHYFLCVTFPLFVFVCLFSFFEKVAWFGFVVPFQ